MEALLATCRVNLPLMSVMVPLDVPTSMILAPIIDSPFASVIVPAIVLWVCCTSLTAGCSTFCIFLFSPISGFFEMVTCLFTTE
ncbi:hypothetical protein SDC9_128712 [bioreactor metagenome]|uniref:Uncharacterized protein n=1 Tax=bioreactor metagenome TaxID=1076179 RepID=A0A645CXS9_9ZZZZ